MEKIDPKNIEEKYKEGKEPHVDISKLPCWNCFWRYSLHCPRCEWNKDGKVNVY